MTVHRLDLGQWGLNPTIARATLLDDRGRNAYRAAADSVGLEAVATVDVTWRAVELVRSFLT